MKAGLEDRKKVYAVIALMALAVFLFLRVFNSGGNSTVSAASTPTQTPASTRGPAKPAPNLDPSLRLSTLKAVENQQYKGSGRNIFEYAAEKMPDVKTPVVTQQPPPQPVCPPNCPVQQAPPINLKFYGFASRPGEPTRIFLSEGEDIFIGGEGEIINRRYRILHIGKTSVEIEDTLNNNRQTIPLTQG
jgi:hypothetical protein